MSSYEGGHMVAVNTVFNIHISQPFLARYASAEINLPIYLPRQAPMMTPAPTSSTHATSICHCLRHT
jgi:hypothetical protein|eukprot:COSAG01_NODE_2946_length_6812_cov_7.337107_1_plen_67_part_00